MKTRITIANWKRVRLRSDVMALLLMVFGLLMPCSSQSVNLSGTVFEVVGHEANIDPVLLYAVALSESAFNPKATQYVTPYPWTLRTPTKPIYAVSKEDAREKLRVILNSSDRVDVGLMQVNVHWHSRRVDDPLDLLDPITNVRIGAALLNEKLSLFPNDAIKAIGLYHSNDPYRAQWYGTKVWKLYSQLKYCD